MSRFNESTCNLLWFQALVILVQHAHLQCNLKVYLSYIWMFVWEQRLIKVL